MTRAESTHLVRVGVFLTVAVALLVTAVLLVGRSQTLFMHRVRLHTAFDNTSGLVVGAPVRLAGVDVGVVESLRFAPERSDRRVHVTMVVDRRYLDRIRSDSVARLSSKGLLGDTLIDLTVGSVEAATLHDGATVRGQETAGLNEVVGALHEGIDEVRALSTTARERLDAVLTDDLGRDLGRFAHSSADIAEHIEKGDGLAHALVYDPKMARSADRFLADAQRTAADADRAVTRIDGLLDEVQRGNGTLHGLVYRDDGGRLLAQLSRSAEAIQQFLDRLRSGDGLLHELVYDDHGELLANLTALSTTLREIGDEVRQGKGTLGALLEDPTIYEDLKTILGNIKRSRLLRSIIRMTIRSDGLGARPPSPK